MVLKQRKAQGGDLKAEGDDDDDEPGGTLWYAGEQKGYGSAMWNEDHTRNFNRFEFPELSTLLESAILSVVYKGVPGPFPHHPLSHLFFPFSVSFFPLLSRGAQDYYRQSQVCSTLALPNAQIPTT